MGLVTVIVMVWVMGMVFGLVKGLVKGLLPEQVMVKLLQEEVAFLGMRKVEI